MSVLSFFSAWLKGLFKKPEAAPVKRKRSRRGTVALPSLPSERERDNIVLHVSANKSKKKSKQ